VYSVLGDSQKMPLRARLEDVQSRIQVASERAGRDPLTVTLVAVTKNFPLEVARKACALNLLHLGENRVQEMIDKFGDGWLSAEYPSVTLHLIGHLQSNKVRKAVQMVQAIDSVDDVALAESIDKSAAELGKRVRILLEVNTSGEPQKYGIQPEQVSSTVERILPLKNVDLSGLMTVGPNTNDEIAIRRSFTMLRDFFENIQSTLNPPGWSVLSMGMSQDFEIAIEEDATEIRLGTALFGPRRLA
jgi:PLP dependent protein